MFLGILWVPQGEEGKEQQGQSEQRKTWAVGGNSCWLLSLPPPPCPPALPWPSSCGCSQGRNQPPLTSPGHPCLVSVSGRSINHRPEAALIQTGTGNTWHRILWCSEVCFTSHPFFPEIIRQKYGCWGHDTHRLDHMCAPQTQASLTRSAARGRGCWLDNGCAMSQKYRCPPLCKHTHRTSQINIHQSNNPKKQTLP